MGKFVEVLVDNDPEQLEADMVAALEAAFEGWTPAEGNLETWMIKAFARLISTTRAQAATVSTAVFKKFGETIGRTPPILAAPASVTSTWTMTDAAGHTIEDGTEVDLPAGDERKGFRVVGDVVIPPGSEATDAGEVVLQAVEAGEAYNGLSGTPEVVRALAYVDSIELEGVTAGGVDDEDEDAYLERLVEALQTLSTSLIKARDFEIDARAVAGIARAKALEAYDAEAEAEEALCVSVYPVSSDGATVGALVKEELLERQQAKVPDGVNVFVEDPAYTKVKAKSSLVVLPGFEPAAVLAAAEARLQEYLDPGSSDFRSAIYRFELIAELDRVPGVDRVVTLELAKEADEFGTADVVLDGVVALTEPGTITITEAP